MSVPNVWCIRLGYYLHFSTEINPEKKTCIYPYEPINWSYNVNEVYELDTKGPMLFYWNSGKPQRSAPGRECPPGPASTGPGRDWIPGLNSMNPGAGRDPGT